MASCRSSGMTAPPEHFAWGGALVGAALCIIAPPVGIAAVAVSAGAVAGAGGIVGHFWNNISKEKLGEVSELIHSGEAALVIVAVNHKGTDISPLLENAKGRIVVETKAGDLDAAFDNALKKAQATQATQATSGT